MGRTEKAKTSALISSAIIIAICFFDSISGVYHGCSFHERILYPFFHAGPIHALINVWCLLSIVFIYSVTICRIMLAYMIAVTIPSFCLSDIPTVGLSGVVFALFGTISFEVQRKAYYQLWMLAYLVAGFFFPNTNALVHLYCYLAGGAVALLNKPVKIG